MGLGADEGQSTGTSCLATGATRQLCDQLCLAILAHMGPPRMRSMLHRITLPTWAQTISISTALDSEAWGPSA